MQNVTRLPGLHARHCAAGLVQEGHERNAKEHRNRLGRLDEAPRLSKVLGADPFQRQHLHRVPETAQPEAIGPGEQAQVPVLGGHAQHQQG